MLATPTPEPGRLPVGPQWLYEVKWDGVRILADTTGGQLRLIGRQGRDAAVAYPELAAIGDRAAVGGGGTILDGEVVALRDGVPSFHALAERMHVRDAARAAALAVRVPISYMVFDVPVLDGVDLTGRPFEERRAVLGNLALPAPVSISPLYPDGALIWAATAAQGLEGVVAKRRTSRYQPGRRSPDWLKAVHRSSRTAVVGGWRPESTGTGRLGAVLLGAPDADGALRYLGRAGSGVSGALGGVLTDLLGPLRRADAPFDEPVPTVDARGTVWVAPEVRVEVRYLTRTPSGRLRQPVVLGVREDAEVDPWEPA
ncbi:MAG TPA: non-homologous end-joining DNA ligase [Cellulomonas sp.]